jgi:hypothetical protein
MITVAETYQPSALDASPVDQWLSSSGHGICDEFSSAKQAVLHSFNRFTRTLDLIE